jgi:hypothetical protein
LISLIAAGLLATTAMAQGPSSEYYITDGGSGLLSVVQGTTVVRSWTQRDTVMPIAVTNTIKTYIQYGGQFGSEYDLSGNWTGTDYPDVGPPGQNVDGATDGVSHNWLASWNGLAIWEYDLDWGNPVQLIPNLQPTGVTYDGTSGHLWVINWADATIVEFDLAGNALSKFSYGNQGDWLGCLAWEPATDTLWAEVFNTGELRQYDKAGNLLQSVTVPALAGYAWGGEFQIGNGCPAASQSNYGTGWPGTNGTPTIAASAPPSFGANITIDISNSLGANTQAAVILGITPTSVVTSLGGTLLVIPQLIVVVPMPAAGLHLPGTVPSDPALCGLNIYMQALEADGGASKGVSFTNGLKLTLGT